LDPTMALDAQQPPLPADELCPPASALPPQTFVTTILESAEEAQRQEDLYEEDFSEDGSGGAATQRQEEWASRHGVAAVQQSGTAEEMASAVNVREPEDSERFTVVSAVSEQERGPLSASESEISRPAFACSTGSNKLSVMNGSDELLAMRAELNRIMEDTDTLLAPAQADVA